MLSPHAGHITAQGGPAHLRATEESVLRTVQLQPQRGQGRPIGERAEDEPQEVKGMIHSAPDRICALFKLNLV